MSGRTIRAVVLGLAVGLATSALAQTPGAPIVVGSGFAVGTSSTPGLVTVDTSSLMVSHDVYVFGGINESYVIHAAYPNGTGPCGSGNSVIRPYLYDAGGARVNSSTLPGVLAHGGTLTKSVNVNVLIDLDSLPYGMYQLLWHDQNDPLRACGAAGMWVEIGASTPSDPCASDYSVLSASLQGDLQGGDWYVSVNDLGASLPPGSDAIVRVTDSSGGLVAYSERGTADGSDPFARPFVDFDIPLAPDTYTIQLAWRCNAAETPVDQVLGTFTTELEDGCAQSFSLGGVGPAGGQNPCDGDWALAWSAGGTVLPPGAVTVTLTRAGDPSFSTARSTPHGTLGNPIPDLAPFGSLPESDTYTATLTWDCEADGNGNPIEVASSSFTIDCASGSGGDTFRSELSVGLAFDSCIAESPSAFPLTFSFELTPLPGGRVYSSLELVPVFEDGSPSYPELWTGPNNADPPAASPGERYTAPGPYSAVVAPGWTSATPEGIRRVALLFATQLPNVAPGGDPQFEYFRSEIALASLCSDGGDDPGAGGDGAWTEEDVARLLAAAEGSEDELEALRAELGADTLSSTGDGDLDAINESHGTAISGIAPDLEMPTSATSAPFGVEFPLPNGASQTVYLALDPRGWDMSVPWLATLDAIRGLIRALLAVLVLVHGANAVLQAIRQY